MEGEREAHLWPTSFSMFCSQFGVAAAVEIEIEIEIEGVCVCVCVCVYRERRVSEVYCRQSEQL